MSDPIHAEIERLALSLLEEHQCHTVILYGSWARGDATDESDVDVVCIRPAGPTLRDARVVDGRYLDGFVYPESAFSELEPSLLRMVGGRVLRERDGLGTALLARLRQLDERGPGALPEDDRRMRNVWARKMLDRFRGRLDVESSYRRTQLLYQALEDYFALRETWFRGPKVAFPWLRTHDPETFRAFEQAAEGGGNDTAFEQLVERVYGSPRVRAI